MDISRFLIVDPDKVYLVSYYGLQGLIEFDKSQPKLKNFLVIGGPVPIKSMPVENGVRIYLLPDEFDNLHEITEIGGYLAKGVMVTMPIKRII